MPTKLSKKDSELLKSLKSAQTDPRILNNINNKRLLKILCFLYIYDKKEYSQIVKKVLKHLSTNVKDNIDAVTGVRKPKQALKENVITSIPEDDNIQKNIFLSEMLKSKLNQNPNFSTIVTSNELPKISNTTFKKEKPDANFTVQFKLNGSEVKRGYGVIIHETDYHQLKINKRTTKNVFDYYLGYIFEQHQQNDDYLLQNYKLRVNIFKTNLMDLYTDNYTLEPIECKFSNVASLTHHINSAHRSISNIFDLILIPFIEGMYGFKLVLVDIANKTLRLYDPLKINKMNDRYHYNYKYISYALNYINDEYFYITGDRLATDWSIYENEITCLDNFAQCGLYVCFFAHCILKGNFFPVNSHSIIDIFYDKLLEIVGDQAMRFTRLLK